MTLRQAFSKWYESASEAERAKAPEIVEALTGKTQNPSGNKQGLEEGKRRHGAPSPVVRARPVTGRSSTLPPSPRSRPASQRSADKPVTAAPAPSAPKTATVRSVKVAVRLSLGSGSGTQPTPGQSAGSQPVPGTVRTIADRAADPRPARWGEVDNIEAEPPLDYPPLVLPEVIEDDACFVRSYLAGGESLATESPKASAPTRVPGIRRAQTVARFQVGLDFGTSSTKVTYVRLGTAERVVRPMMFDHGLRDYPRYCLPSVGTFDRRGNLLVADAAARELEGAEWTAGLSRVKMLVAGRYHSGYRDMKAQARYDEHVTSALNSPSEFPPEAFMSTFLALTMRRVRRRLQAEVGHEALDIWFNTCVPIDQVENDPVVTAFRRVMLVAEQLEREGSDEANLRAWADRACLLLANPSELRRDGNSKVSLVPEALAASANYVASIRRTAGIHAVVDIGSGTTDVSVFYLSLTKHRGAVTDWFASRSIPMGAGHVERWVASELQGQTGTSVVRPGDIIDAICNKGPHASAVRPLILKALTTIWNRTTPCWAHAYGNLRNASAWEGDKVKVFLAGGGGLIPEASSVFRQSWGKRLGPYPCAVLPSPDGREHREAPFARLCVAYGLTIPVPEMGEYVLPADVSDYTPPPLPVRPVEQSGDQLVPKYGWL